MSKIVVRFLDKMGDDLTAARMARQSFAKDTSLNADGSMKEADRSLLAYLVRGMPAKEFDGWVEGLFHQIGEMFMQESNDKDLLAKAILKDSLLKFRAIPQHFAPFTHAKLSVQITAPLFSARQLWKSVVGLAISEHDLAWSEESRRYVDADPEFYRPAVLHLRADNVKQGCSANTIGFEDYCASIYKEGGMFTPETLLLESETLYARMLRDGIAPEEARAWLVNLTNVTWTWTGSLLAFCRIIGLRTDKHAQLMCTQEIGSALAEIVREHFPVSYALLVQGEGL